MGVDYFASFCYGFVLIDSGINLSDDYDEREELIEELCKKFNVTYHRVGNCYSGETDYVIDFGVFSGYHDLYYGVQEISAPPDDIPARIVKAWHKAQEIAKHYGIDKIEPKWLMAGYIS